MRTVEKCLILQVFCAKPADDTGVNIRSFIMSATQNLTKQEKKGYQEIRWDDREFCGFYMVWFCLHDLFVNTKSDLGPCPRVHDLKLKESFEKSLRHDEYVPRFEAELAQFCENLVQYIDRKVQ